MTRIDTDDGIVVIDESDEASPQSMAAALKSIAELTIATGRSVAVLGEMTDLDVDDGEITAAGAEALEEYDRIGRLAVRLNIKKLIVVGHRARHIHNAAGLEGSWSGESVLVATPQDAYDLLRADMQAGDVMLVKASLSAGLAPLVTQLIGGN